MLSKAGLAKASIFGLFFSLLGAEPTSSAGPNVRFVFSPKQMTSQIGFALIGEAGENLTRLNATVGYQIGLSQRLKLSVDQLNQKITYDFINGKVQKWVKQIAGGGSYKYYLDDRWFDSIDVGGWYSRATSRSLSSVVVETGPSTWSVYYRKIAGGEAWHGYVGTTVLPWDGASLGLSVTYDQVDYQAQALKNKDVSGAGFALDFNQRFSCLDFNIRGDLSPVYNHIGGTINWTLPDSWSNIALGAYGDYTEGKKGLQNSALFGIQLNYSFGGASYAAPFYRGFCARDKTRPRQDLMEWIADPAVLMPVVLAIADECSPGISTILPDVFVDLGPYNINTAGAFEFGKCRAVTFTATGLPPDASINPHTGVISGINFGLFSAPFNVTVSAECSCGYASSRFVLTEETL